MTVWTRRSGGQQLSQIIPLALSLFTSELPLSKVLNSQVFQQTCSVFSDGYCGHLNWRWSRTYRTRAAVNPRDSPWGFRVAHRENPHQWSSVWNDTTGRPCFPACLITRLWDRRSSCELGTKLQNQLSYKLDLFKRQSRNQLSLFGHKWTWAELHFPVIHLDQSSNSSPWSKQVRCQSDLGLRRGFGPVAPGRTDSGLLKSMRGQSFFNKLKCIQLIMQERQKEQHMGVSCGTEAFGGAAETRVEYSLITHPLTSLSILWTQHDLILRSS